MPHTFLRYNNENIISYFNTCSLQYVPNKIEYLFVCESPPAFPGTTPNRFFYFPHSVQAEPLFSTIVKAVYNINYNKHTDDKKTILLNCLKRDGFYLTDAVDYPINKDDELKNVPENIRNDIIYSQLINFRNKIDNLIKLGKFTQNTKTILIKYNIYDTFHDFVWLNVINTERIPFPYCANCPEVAEKIHSLIGEYINCSI